MEGIALLQFVETGAAAVIVNSSKWSFGRRRLGDRAAVRRLRVTEREESEKEITRYLIDQRPTQFSVPVSIRHNKKLPTHGCLHYIFLVRPQKIL